jgi:hypothetical protein
MDFAAGKQAVFSVRDIKYGKAIVVIEFENNKPLNLYIKGFANEKVANNLIKKVLAVFKGSNINFGHFQVYS